MMVMMMIRTTIITTAATTTRAFYSMWPVVNSSNKYDHRGLNGMII
jgi:hypothetical protein